jgi:hypothetical protein
MASDSAGKSTPAAKGQQDWTDQIADRIESTVDSIKAKTTVPATLAARGVVYGVIVAVLAAALLFLLVLAGIRILDVYLPYHPIGRRVWTVDAGGAAIFLALGAFFWRKRRPKSA